MLRLIRGGGMATDGEPLSVSADSDPPVMTLGLARVFAGIFQRLLVEKRSQEQQGESAA
jgi:hypothetical protein